MILPEIVEAVGIKPYYQDEHGVIYCADCLEILPKMPEQSVDTVITDPVWPNAVDFFGVSDPQALLSTALLILPHLTKRICIHLGLDSDPRFLNAVPLSYKFLRSFSLRYARPHYKGRILYDRDVAYLFGDFPVSGDGRHILGDGPRLSDALSTDANGREADHPCPRKLNHLRWLVGRVSNENDVILDPFLGSGTTAVAAKQLRRRYIGIEIEERYCAVAVDRLRQRELRI